MPRSIACQLFKGESLFYHPAKVIFESFDITFSSASVLDLEDREIARSSTGAVNRAAGDRKLCLRVQ